MSNFECLSFEFCQRGIDNCLLGGKCLIESIVYKVTLTASDGDVKTYTGLTKRKFKDGLYELNAEANNPNHQTSTRLSGYEEGPKYRHQ